MADLPKNADELGTWFSMVWKRLQLQLRLMSDPRVPTAGKLWYVVGWLYILSPIDLIPDFIPVLGQLDDILVFSFCLKQLYARTPADVMREGKIAVGLIQPEKTAAK